MIMNSVLDIDIDTNAYDDSLPTKPLQEPHDPPRGLRYGCYVRHAETYGE